MKPSRFAIAALAVFLCLLTINAVVFPLVFPDGLAEKFLNARPKPLPLFHLLGFVCTALMITLLVGRQSRGGSPVSEGLISGALLGLLVALPEHLHLYALTDASALRQFVPVVWILVTWSVAGLVAGAVMGPQRPATPG